MTLYHPFREGEKLEKMRTRNWSPLTRLTSLDAHRKWQVYNPMRLHREGHALKRRREGGQVCVHLEMQQDPCRGGSNWWRKHMFKIELHGLESES